jgi:hypothetical protein
MSDTEKISVAALISVILRRKLGRTIDVQWLVKDAAYARAIINLSREQGLDDLTGYANKLELLIFGESKTIAKSTAIESVRTFSDTRKLLEEELEEELDETKLDVSKYIGHLR